MNRQFPALRGIAILLVIVNHAVTLSLAESVEANQRAATAVELFVLMALKELGVIAVPVFLFLSAAFLVYALQSRPINAGYKVVVSSLKHIVWPYVFWSFVFFLVMFLIKGERSSPLQYAKNILVGYPFNFVPLLIFFYLLSPLLVWAGKRAPWAVAAGFGLYQLFLINALKPGIMGFAFPEWTYALTPPVLRVTLAVWGIFFPLGILYSLHRARFHQVLERFWPLIAAAAAVLYVLAVLHAAGSIAFPLAEVFLPVVLILLAPLVRREWIPAARSLEQIGKRSYGLYLTNLIIIMTVLMVIRVIAPPVLGWYLLVVPILVLAALLLPLFLINATDRITGPTASRYVFG